MTEQEYLTQRVDDQIAWYDRKSMANQKAFKRLRVIEIAAAAMIPLLAGQVSATTIGLKWIVGGLGAAVAIVAGLLSIYRLQENWTEYRGTCEALRHERFLFLARAEPYVDGSLNRFVQRIEGLISKEHRGWAQQMRQSSPRPPGTGTGAT